MKKRLVCFTDVLQRAVLGPVFGKTAVIFWGYVQCSEIFLFSFSCFLLFHVHLGQKNMSKYWKRLFQPGNGIHCTHSLVNIHNTTMKVETNFKPLLSILSLASLAMKDKTFLFLFIGQNTQHFTLRGEKNFKLFNQFYLWQVLNGKI